MKGRRRREGEEEEEKVVCVCVCGVEREESDLYHIVHKWKTSKNPENLKDQWEGGGRSLNSPGGRSHNFSQCSCSKVSNTTSHMI